MKYLHMIAFVLLVVGGLNWGLVALGFNLVDEIFGMGTMLSQIIYGLVGLSAIYIAATHMSDCKACASKPAGMM